MPQCIKNDQMKNGRNEQSACAEEHERPSLACRAICRLFFRHVVRIIKYVVEMLMTVIRKNVGTSGRESRRSRQKNLNRIECVTSGTCSVTLSHTRVEPLLFARARNQPLQNSVEVRLFFCADAVAAHLAVRHGLEVQRIDEFID